MIVFLAIIALTIGALEVLSRMDSSNPSGNQLAEPLRVER